MLILILISLFSRQCRHTVCRARAIRCAFRLPKREVEKFLAPVLSQLALLPRGEPFMIYQKACFPNAFVRNVFRKAGLSERAYGKFTSKVMYVGESFLLEINANGLRMAINDGQKKVIYDNLLAIPYIPPLTFTFSDNFPDLKEAVLERFIERPHSTKLFDAVRQLYGLIPQRALHAIANRERTIPHQPVNMEYAPLVDLFQPIRERHIPVVTIE